MMIIASDLILCNNIVLKVPQICVCGNKREINENNLF